MSGLGERLEALHADIRRWVYESGLGDGHEPSRLLRQARDLTGEAAAALSRYESVPASGLTAQAHKTIRERCELAGIDMFDAKSRIPIEPRLVVDLISALAEQAAALSRYEAERDEVTLLLRKAREAKNGTARDFDGEALSGFVLDHRDYLAMHCLLNQEAEDRRLSSAHALHDGKGGE